MLWQFDVGDLNRINLVEVGDAFDVDLVGSGFSTVGPFLDGKDVGFNTAHESNFVQHRIR